jgi:hypothetical protein
MAKRKDRIGSAGVYYVLAELSRRGFLACPTPGNEKICDIIAIDDDKGRTFKIEVKTTEEEPRSDRIHGSGKFHCWLMGKKNEEAIAKEDSPQLPRYFIVPCQEVADHLSQEHARYLQAKEAEGSVVRDDSRRWFRIPSGEPSPFESNWGIFEI